MAYPKQKRIESPKYLQYIRDQRCCVCFGTPVNPHHLVTRGAGGSDYFTVPLCQDCHTRLGSMGQDTFQVKNNINLWMGCAVYLAAVVVALENKEAD